MSGFTALVIGATGATGTELVEQLMDDNQYTSVIVFSRRPLLVTGAKPVSYTHLRAHETHH
jgi:uncharacterized protein YbjT (DUF2867 family)